MMFAKTQLLTLTKKGVCPSGGPPACVLSRSPSPASKRKAVMATAAVLTEDTETSASPPKLKRPKLYLHKYTASDRESLSGNQSLPLHHAVSSIYAVVFCTQFSDEMCFEDSLSVI